MYSGTKYETVWPRNLDFGFKNPMFQYGSSLMKFDNRKKIVINQEALKMPLWEHSVSGYSMVKKSQLYAPGAMWKYL